MDFTNLMRQASIEKNSLSGSSFTRINVSTNTNVSVLTKFSLSSHIKTYEMLLIKNGNEKKPC